MHPKHFRII